MDMLKPITAAAAIMALGAMLVPGLAIAEEFTPTVLCATNSESDECEQEDIYAKGTTIAATSENVTLSTHLGETLATVTCKSTLEAETTESIDTFEQDAEITSLTFTSCISSGFSCSIETLGLPYEASVLANAESPGDGRLAVWDESGEAPPAIRVKCALIGLDCVYETAEELELESAEGTTEVVPFQVQGGSPATATVTEAASKAQTPEGGNCVGSEEGTLSGTWEASEPEPLQVKQAPFGVAVDPNPIVIKELGKPTTVTVTNTGAKTDWELAAIGNTATKLTVDDKECVGETLKANGGKCAITVQCNEAGTWTLTVGWNVPPSDVIGTKDYEVKCG